MAPPSDRTFAQTIYRSPLFWIGLACIGASITLFTMWGEEVIDVPPPPRPMKTGFITLESIPQGATILLDGKSMELVDGELAKTPSDLHSLQYGTTYRIELKKEGYKRYRQSFVMGKERANETIRPTLEAHPGTFLIEVPGEGGRETMVFLNGLEMGYGPRITKKHPANTMVRLSAEYKGKRCEVVPPRVLVRPKETYRVTVWCRSKKLKK